MHADWALDELEPIPLAELVETAGLLTRLDRKYVVTWDVARELVAELAPAHRILEIAGRRSFAYRSVYFDSPSLGAYRAHVQQRRRRYKCRTRHYLDSDAHLFEVKLKGLRGATIKHQLPLAGPEEQLGTDALAFAGHHVERAYGRRPAELTPSIRTEYRRVTLAGGEHRVTLDHHLSFHGDGTKGALGGEYVIVESKGPHGPGAADLALRRRGVRPVECSKYCVGVALLRDDVRANGLQWLMRRYFVRHEVADA